ncbi:helix-turn-helix domain-containing protein [Spirosoma areae]
MKALFLVVVSLICLQSAAQKPVRVALSEKPRPGQPSKFDKATQAHLTALVCSEAPDGRSRWTLRLLAERLVELRLVESVSHQAVGEQLKKTSLNPGSSSNGTSPR